MQFMDADGNGEVSKDEFATWWLSGCKGMQGFCRSAALTNSNIENMFVNCLEYDSEKSLL